MAPLQFITRAFIDVFGITHPTQRQQRTATIFITSLLALIVAGMLIVVTLLYRLGHH